MRRYRSQPPILSTKPGKIAIFRALFLGDFLCATPAFRELRRLFPEAEISLIGLPWTRDLVGRVPYLDRLVEFVGYENIMDVPYVPERTAAFLEETRAYGYDLAIQMHGSGGVSNGVVADLGAAFTLGYRPGRAKDPRLSFSLPFPEHEHEIVRWLKLVQLLDTGEAPRDSRPRLPMLQTEFPLRPADHAAATALLAGASGSGPLVALHTGAKDPARRWPVAQFAALGDMLVEAHGARIVLTGSAGERELTAAVRAQMRHPALDLAGESELGVFAALIDALDLIVTNDTGASHIAAAVQTPSVVLFGPTRPDNWAPLDHARHHVIDALHYAASGASPADALRDLPVAPVFARCSELIGVSLPLREVAVNA